MDKQKEIEEMAKYCCRACGIYSGDNKCSLGGDMTKCDISVNAATQLINAGYGNVKQAVKEFSKRILDAFEEVGVSYNFFEKWDGMSAVDSCSSAVKDIIKELYGDE